MSDGPIAIVGVSCRFPGAENLDAFWQLLASASDAVGEVDGSRWSTRFYYHPNRGQPGKSYTWSAGLISGIDLFEPSFFGISPREAGQMDQQQRLLLELVWHALEDAGIPPSVSTAPGTSPRHARRDQLGLNRRDRKTQQLIGWKLSRSRAVSS